MKNMEILYMGFKGKNNASFQLLNKIAGSKAYLTNSFNGCKSDIMKIEHDYDMAVMFGVDTQLKDTLRIEIVAEYNGIRRGSRIDSNAIRAHFKVGGIQSSISKIPTRYLCNAAYYYMLEKTDGRAIFIHIPSVKNMSELMMEKISVCMKNIEYDLRIHNGAS